MNNKILFTFILALLSAGCKHGEVSLASVSDLPGYFDKDYRFGKDISAVNRADEWIIITGKIDTTSEFPPVHLAVIAVGSHKFFLPLRKSGVNNGETVQRYAGDGYSLQLVYRENNVKANAPVYGYVIVENGNAKTQYNVVGALE